MGSLRSPLGQAVAGDKAAEGHASFAHKLEIGHQEIDRIVDEIEQIYNSQPLEWLPLAPIGNMIVMLHDWYEDYDEFEDACGGSFEEFLAALPQFEIRHVPTEASADGGDSGGGSGDGGDSGVVDAAPEPAGGEGAGSGGNADAVASTKAEFRVLKPDPDAPPTVLTLEVAERSDLWRVLYKSPEAAVRIPHLEFEIGADSKRRIDTVYNHITHAVWNLSSHLRAQMGSGAGDAPADSNAAAILETVDALEALLDLPEPFTIIVDDPTGASSFKPDDGVERDEL